MQPLNRPPPPPARQLRGLALLEALVAWVVLSFGVLGLLWMHQHALSQQRQHIMRAIAADLAEDMAERMRLNAPQRTLYAKAWGPSTSAAPNCNATACTRQELAMWDMQQLQQTLESQLPEGDAAIFALTDAPAWWGIVIAWRDANESYRTDSLGGTPPCPAQMSCWRLLFRPDR